MLETRRRLWIRVILALCAVTAASLMSAAGRGPGVGRDPDGSLDVIRFDGEQHQTWQPCVDKAVSRLEDITKGLIAASENERLSPDDRRKAILLLGKLGNKEALEFLIAKVSLRLPVRRIRGDTDMLKMFPCWYALSEGDWRTLEVVLRSVTDERKRVDLARLAGVLRDMVGTKLGVGMVEYQLHRAVGAVHKKNLVQIRKFLLQ